MTHFANRSVIKLWGTDGKVSFQTRKCIEEKSSVFTKDMLVSPLGLGYRVWSNPCSHQNREEVQCKRKNYSNKNTEVKHFGGGISHNNPIAPICTIMHIFTTDGKYGCDRMVLCVVKRSL